MHTDLVLATPVFIKAPFIGRALYAVYSKKLLRGIYILPKTKKFGCVGRGDLTFLLLSKVVK